MAVRRRYQMFSVYGLYFADGPLSAMPELIEGVRCLGIFDARHDSEARASVRKG